MKRILALLLSLSLLCSAGCSSLSDEQKIIRSNTSGVYDLEYDYGLTYNYASFINDDSVVIPLTASDQAMYHYFNRIKTDDENDLSWAYDEIIYAVTHLSNPNADFGNMADIVLPKGITEEQLWEVCLAICSDHPELWYFRMPSMNCYKIHEENNRLVYFSYSDNLSDIPAKNQEIQLAADGVLKKIKGMRSAQDVCTALAGILSETSRAGDEGFADSRHSCSFNVLTQHMGNCYAFAQTYCYLLQKQGIPAFINCGGADGEITHTWATVSLDGTLRYVDVYHMAKEYNSYDYSIGRYLLFEDASVLCRIHEKFFVSEGFPMAGSPVDAPIVSDGSPIVEFQSDKEVAS